MQYRHMVWLADHCLLLVSTAAQMALDTRDGADLLTELRLDWEEPVCHNLGITETLRERTA